jgi:hypothetical protein
MNSFGNFKFLVGKMVHIPKWEFRDVTTVNCCLRCSSGPVIPASSVTQALSCSLTWPTEPTTVGRAPHRRTPPPDRHRDRAPMSLPLPFTPNQNRSRLGLLPGRFPTDQRLPADRIWSVSHRRRGGFFPPCFISRGPKHPRGLGRLAEQAEPCCGLSPSAQCTFWIIFRFLLN